MKKDRAIYVRLAQETVDELDEIAKERGITRSVVVRNLLAGSKLCYPLLERSMLPDNYDVDKLAKITADLMIHLINAMVKIMKEGGKL